MGLRVVEPPEFEPITPAFLRDHAKLDAAEPDAVLGMYISAARETCEHLTGRILCRQELVLEVDAFPASIRLPPPVHSVQSVTYRGADNVLGIIAPADYVLDDSSLSAYVMPVSGLGWPQGATAGVNAVNVRFIAGYASPDEIPAALRHWVAIRAATAVQNREAHTTGPLSALSFVDAMLDRWRVYP